MKTTTSLLAAAFVLSLVPMASASLPSQPALSATPDCGSTLSNPPSHFWCHTDVGDVDCYHSAGGYDCVSGGDHCYARLDGSVFYCNVGNLNVGCVRLPSGFYFCEAWGGPARTA